ncbi:MAG TPA: hypothetical protein VED63_03400, partial [Acidimicrobiales bacterium]|nr:hypothetical protein [Acidimicrobiales bacterium]
MTGDRNAARVVRLVLVLAVAGVFVGIVAFRGGPALDDAFGVIRPTTALSHGEMVVAARDEALPQPPGYPLLAAPFVVALRPVLGSPGWCDGQVPEDLRVLVTACGSHPIPWYRSQAVLAILAWIVLAAGCVRLLRVAAGGGWNEVFLVAVLAALPAASDGIVETFHPQDLVCVGLIAAAVAEALRRRWVLAGLTFGLAFAC